MRPTGTTGGDGNTAGSAGYPEHELWEVVQGYLALRDAGCDDPPGAAMI